MPEVRNDPPATRRNALLAMPRVGDLLAPSEVVGGEAVRDKLLLCFFLTLTALGCSRFDGVVSNDGSIRAHNKACRMAEPMPTFRVYRDSVGVGSGEVEAGENVIFDARCLYGEWVVLRDATEEL